MNKLLWFRNKNLQIMLCALSFLVLQSYGMLFEHKSSVKFVITNVKLVLLILGIIAYRRTNSNQSYPDEKTQISSQGNKKKYLIWAGIMGYGILMFTVPFVNKLTNYFIMPAYLIFIIIEYGYHFFINIKVYRGLQFIINRKFDKAIMAYDFLINKYPTWGFPYQNRGYAYYETGHKTKALADFKKALVYLSPTSDDYKKACNAIQFIENNDDQPDEDI